MGRFSASGHHGKLHSAVWRLRLCCCGSNHVDAFGPLGALASHHRILGTNLTTLALSKVSRTVTGSRPLGADGKRDGPGTGGSNNGHIIILSPNRNKVSAKTVKHGNSGRGRIILTVTGGIHSVLHGRKVSTHLAHSNSAFVPLCSHIRVTRGRNTSLFVSVRTSNFAGPGTTNTSMFTLSGHKTDDTVTGCLSRHRGHTSRITNGGTASGSRLLRRILFSLIRASAVGGDLALNSRVLGGVGPIRGLRDHGARRTTFIILGSPSIPSILIRASFVAGPRRRQLLNATTFHRGVTATVTRNIVDCFR